MVAKKKKEAGKRLPSPGKIKVGDIIAIPLGSGHWGYVRTYKDATFAILSATSHATLLPLKEVIGSETLAFTGYHEPWDEPTWMFLGKWRFEDADDSWPPPVFQRDVINPKIISIYHKGHLNRIQDLDEIKGMEAMSGLCFPGQVVEKIRKALDMPIDREQIERIAPFTTDWSGHKPSEQRFFPFAIEEVGDRRSNGTRLTFGNWDWVQENFGNSNIDNYSLNGHGVEGIIKAIRLSNGFVVEHAGIEYSSEGDVCCVYFSDRSDAEEIATLTTETLKDIEQARKMVAVACEHGFKEN